VLKVRRYQQNDKEIVKALHFAGLEQMGGKPHAAFDNDLDRIAEYYLKDGDFLVGLEGDEIVAIGAVRKTSDSKGEIKRVRVRQDSQRKGYGRRMVLSLIERAAELGFRELSLDTLAGNIPARRLFEDLGFIETGGGKVGGFNLVYYEKHI
jgi:ribosomal protein S18 acetylase RimI-like enzyme